MLTLELDQLSLQLLELVMLGELVSTELLLLLLKRELLFYGHSPPIGVVDILERECVFMYSNEELLILLMEMLSEFLLFLLLGN
jgi:hypothetical protein